MKYTSYQRQILATIYKANAEVDLYLLHKQFQLSPSQILITVTELEEHKLIERVGVVVKATQKGRNWIYAHRKEIFMNIDRYWATPTLNESQLPPPMQPYFPEKVTTNEKNPVVNRQDQDRSD
ncbi:hypothetical protein PsAD46_01285 [Pseudovibrio sp. Ad46]|uniref:hypothetical protein n=1 Tax=unclassified Pseudovibrio TaxID=2627060 RepID=UPI0007AE5969|nr:MULTISPECIES: hypothetical protein [unclassified Pseudovibrio]KZK94033.1 hypothetical protein PsAD46_01285 [Pseudovibrio sp. Ad46]KZL01973.1 hypothetical protein PsAD5_00225 [Pseudovibrio sp. Ad5]